jgi:hypothetical protein
VKIVDAGRFLQSLFKIHFNKKIKRVQKSLSKTVDSGAAARRRLDQRIRIRNGIRGTIESLCTRKRGKGANKER